MSRQQNKTRIIKHIPIQIQIPQNIMVKNAEDDGLNIPFALPYIKRTAGYSLEIQARVRSQLTLHTKSLTENDSRENREYRQAVRHRTRAIIDSYNNCFTSYTTQPSEEPQWLGQYPEWAEYKRLPKNQQVPGWDWQASIKKADPGRNFIERIKEDPIAELKRLESEYIHHLGLKERAREIARNHEIPVPRWASQYYNDSLLLTPDRYHPVLLKTLGFLSEYSDNCEITGDTIARLRSPVVYNKLTTHEKFLAGELMDMFYRRKSSRN